MLEHLEHRTADLDALDYLKKLGNEFEITLVYKTSSGICERKGRFAGLGVTPLSQVQMEFALVGKSWKRLAGIREATSMLDWH